MPPSRTVIEVEGPTAKAVAEAKAVLKAARKAVREKRVKHVSAKPSRGRVVDKAYKGFIAQLPCLATLCREKREAYGVHVAHVRHSYPHPGWGNPGLQRKPDDWRTVPLSPTEHRAQHAMNEAAYYAQLGVYPPDLCRDLHTAFPDIEAAKGVLRRCAGMAENSRKTATNGGFSDTKSGVKNG